MRRTCCFRLEPTRRVREGATGADSWVQRSYMELAATATMAGITAVALGILGLFILNPRKVVVVGESMEPTLMAGDRLLIVRAPRIRAGDLVVLCDPEDVQRIVIKRCSAVAKDGVQVLGDNPERSTDSRHWGMVPKRLIVGKAVYRYSPQESAGKIR